MRKIIVATDSFKGTLTSFEATKIISDELKKHLKINIKSIPIADGGEGTLEAISQYETSHKVMHECMNLQWGKIKAEYLLLSRGLAFIECAKTAGINLVKGSKNVGDFTTFGVGEQILHAIKNGAKEIYVALGGSGTNDFGCGLACALGAKFFDSNGTKFIPTGNTLCNVAKIDISKLLLSTSGVEIFALCDVINPPYGENGAAYIYAPQKGASKEDCDLFDNGVRHMCELSLLALNKDVHNLKGGGAAGAMGAGLVAFCNANIKSGIEFILNKCDFESELDGCDLVITGEGCTDAQSLNGKVISGISNLARKKDIPVVIISGRTKGDVSALYNIGIKGIFSTTEFSHEISHEEAVMNLRIKASEVCEIIKREWKI